MLNEALQAKFGNMKEILRSLDSVAVAFSGGADSALVLKVALDTLGRNKVIAVTGKSDSIAESELEEACRLARDLGAKHVILETNEFENESYLANPVNRCYYCKATLYERMGQYIKNKGLATIVNGTNADDLGDWRPGNQAAVEYQVRAPAAEAGITKQEIRILSEWFELPTFDKPASPCLSSRVPYEQHITPEKLKMIEKAEAYLKSLGIRECRVRHHENLARIEVNPPDMELLMEPEIRRHTDRYFRKLGYHYVALDLRGFRSGSMNEVIQVKVTR